MKNFALAATLVLVGCTGQAARQGAASSDTASASYHYHIKEDGAPDVTDRTSYASIGDVTFKRNQKYKITGLTDAAREPHILVTQMTEKVGAKVITRDALTLMPMQDGSYTYNCDNFYSEKLSKSENDIPDPVCTFKVIGVMPIADQAVVEKS